MNRPSPEPVSRLKMGISARLGVIVLLLVGTAPVWAQNVAPSLRAAVIASAVGYERSIREGDGPLRIIIASDTAGQRDGDTMLDAFRAFASRSRISGRTVQLRRAVHNGDVADTLRGNAHVVYIANGTDTATARQIIAAMQDGQIAVCGDGSLASRGCALGVEPHANRARPVIHLATARGRGLSFEGRLLRLSRVIQ